MVSPGAWLTDMCQERYEVREKKSNKKVSVWLVLCCVTFFFIFIFAIFIIGLDLPQAYLCMYSLIFAKFHFWVLDAETKRVEGYGEHGKWFRMIMMQQHTRRCWWWWRVDDDDDDDSSFFIFAFTKGRLICHFLMFFVNK